MTAPPVDWRPSRRTFLKSAGAALVMVQVGPRWPGSATVDAASTGGATGGGGAGLRPDRLRRAATEGPPTGRFHGNVIVHDTVIDGAAFRVWYGDGGRAMAIGQRKGAIEAYYVDPTRRVGIDAVTVTPLAQLGQEIRAHFGEREWLAMLRAART